MSHGFKGGVGRLNRGFTLHAGLEGPRFDFGSFRVYFELLETYFGPSGHDFGLLVVHLGVLRVKILVFEIASWLLGSHYIPLEIKFDTWASVLVVWNYILYVWKSMLGLC